MHIYTQCAVHLYAVRCTLTHGVLYAYILWVAYLQRVCYIFTQFVLCIYVQCDAHTHLYTLCLTFTNSVLHI